MVDPDKPVLYKWVMYSTTWAGLAGGKNVEACRVETNWEKCDKILLYDTTVEGAKAAKAREAACWTRGASPPGSSVEEAPGSWPLCGLSPPDNGKAGQLQHYGGQEHVKQK